MALGTKMQQRRATLSVWALTDYILDAGELGIATDVKGIKIGDGVSTWSELDYAFDGLFLPTTGKAADSELLDGIDSTGYYKTADASVTATADKLAKRDGEGQLKAATAVADEDLVPLLQMNASIATGIVDGRKEAIVRTVTAATTVATTDVNQILLVNHASLTAQVVVTVPTNATAAIPIGTWVDICAIGAGGVKITPAGGVTINGTSNVFPGYGLVRILKTATDVWLGISLSSQRQGRLPKVRAVRTSTTTYGAGVWGFVPYNSLDSTVDFYNPDNEWFSVPGTGLPTARRIIANKAGEYLAVVNLLSSVQTISYARINLMVADNTLAGGRVLASQPCFLAGNLSARVRLAAGESIGTSYLEGSGSADATDGTLDYRNDLTITRLGD